MSIGRISGALLCAGILAASFAVSSMLPSNAPKKTGKVPENDYSEMIVKEPEIVRRDCVSLSVDGEFIGYYPTADDAVVAVENAAYRQVSAEYDEYDGYDIISAYDVYDVTMTEDEFLASEKSTLPRLAINVYSTSVKRVSVPFSTKYVNNANEYIGYEKVRSNGSDGVNEEIYRVVYRDGELIETKKTGEKVISYPVDKVIEQGTKYKKSTQIFIFPYDGRITSQFGGRYLMGYTNHRGIDIAGINHQKYNSTGKIERADCFGDDIHAAGSGKVVFAGYGSSYGYYVVIEHSNGLRTYYGHQSKILVKVGDYVKQGDVIGRIGNSGNSYGAHVHFEIRVPGSDREYTDCVDPADYLIGYDEYPLDDK